MRSQRRSGALPSGSLLLALLLSAAALLQPHCASAAAAAAAASGASAPAKPRKPPGDKPPRLGECSGGLRVLRTAPWADGGLQVTFGIDPALANGATPCAPLPRFAPT